MSFLGIDVGTTGCKAIVFDENGRQLGSAYREYDMRAPKPRQAELDSEEVWSRIKETIRLAAASAGPGDPIEALSVTSMGEAVVPVGKGGEILAPSILNVDIRGEEYIEPLKTLVSEAELYDINGNVLANQYTLPKLMWLKEHEPELYERSEHLLLWGSFVSYKLGADPRVDYSLANRTLLFDLARETWSERMLAAGGIDREKLPDPVAAGTRIGTVSAAIADELGLPRETAIVMGAHDQCANSVGAGSVEPGMAMYGMGTFPCITPVYDSRPETGAMLELGLNTEHHAVRGLWASFIYHMGGASIKWFRDHVAGSSDVSYEDLFREMPDEVGPVLVLPHFAPMGPPDYIADSTGVILGLTTETSRGAILRGIIEANAFALKRVVRRLPSIGVHLDQLRAVGGGSRSPEALQINANILDAAVARPAVDEAGALGAAILAGTGVGRFASAAEAASALVKIEQQVEPQREAVERYDELFERYEELRKLVVPFNQEWTRRKLS
ncbi:MAG: FGGY-family carbohydrate kinase [Alkalispirochaetaceae bacterium]